MAKKFVQLELKGTRGRGGKRRGAGRKNRTGTVNHMIRERVDFRYPLHITHRLNAGFPTLRRSEFLHVFRRCSRLARRFGLHVLHYSVLSNHIHMIVEARDNEALGLGMRSLAGTFAKYVMKKARRKGRVFAGRYHLRKVISPTQMRNVLEYVLLNSSKHRGAVAQLDAYSSARFFAGWRELLGRKCWNRTIEREMKFRSDDLELAGISEARSWLARTGWKKAVG